jgi:hypothetical protein
MGIRLRSRSVSCFLLLDGKLSLYDWLLVHLTFPTPSIWVFSNSSRSFKKKKKSCTNENRDAQIYRTICTFSKATRIPMVPSSFNGAGFRIDPKIRFASLTVNPAEVSDQIKAPGISVEQVVYIGPEQNLISTIASIF